MLADVGKYTSNPVNVSLDTLIVLYLVAVLLRLLVLWYNFTGSFSSPLQQMFIRFVGYWTLFQHALSGIQIGTLWRNTYFARILASWSCILCSVICLLPNYFSSLLSSIITDINNSGHTLCLLQIDEISLLAPFILFSDANSCLFLWMSAG